MKKIGEILIEKNYITEEQLVHAIETQKKTGKLFGKQVVDLEYLTEDQLVKILSETLGHDSLLVKPKIDLTLLQQFKKEKLISEVILPIKVIDEAKIEIVVEDPNNLYVKNYIQRLYKEVDIKLASSTNITNWLNETYNELDLLKELNLMEIRNDNLETISINSQVIKLVDDIIFLGLSLKSTDIQISVLNEQVEVRYRINGSMNTLKTYPKEAFGVISTRLKVMSLLNISENRKPQDGSFIVNQGSSKYDMRISIIPSMQYENISIRILYANTMLKNLEHLNMTKNVIEKYREIVKSKEGIILLTGATGSGKTTTLYTTILELIEYYQNEKTIITIEDPVEYRVPYIVQTQVNESRGYTFSSGLRSILRQNPDIILVGEIRDADTARTAVLASNTGHLVFSTLHAGDALRVISVLQQHGVESFNIVNSLRAVLNQRLVGRQCDHCMEKVDIDGPVANWLGQSYVFDSKGCMDCKYTRKKGVVLLTEILIMTDELVDLLSDEWKVSEVRKILSEDTYYSLENDIKEKLKNGEISLKESLSMLKINF